MKYDYAPDLQRIAEEVSLLLFPHIKIDRVRCFRAYGSSARGTIARCHALGKLMQKALAEDAFYAIECLMPQFEKQSKEDQVKTIIHELMHIPQAFGGGFRHHDFVTDRAVNKKYKEYMEILKKKSRFGEKEIFSINIFKV